MGPGAGEERRNGPAVLPLENFSSASLESEIVPDSVLIVKGPEADHFFFLCENIVEASKVQISYSDFHYSYAEKLNKLHVIRSCDISLK